MERATPFCTVNSRLQTLPVIRTSILLATLLLAFSVSQSQADTATLSTTTSGTGGGTVTSNSGGISCPGTCSADYDTTAVVTLTAASSSGSGFVQWTGACSGTNKTCQVTMDAAKGVGAQFNTPTTFASGTLTTNTTWNLSNSPYYLTGTVTINGTLAIEPGVIVKFAPMTGLNINGTLLAQGTTGFPIVFTDYRDDSAGGDTNSDGATTSPGASWAGIYANANSAVTLDRCILKYGGFGYGYGANSYGPVYKAGAGTLSLTNSTITNTNYWSNGIYLDSVTGTVTIAGNTITGATGDGYNGIYLYNSGNTVTISGNTIQSFRWHGIDLKNSSPTIAGNTITGSGEYGLYLTGTSLPNISADNSFSGNSYGFMAFDTQTLANAHLYDNVFPGHPVIMDYIGSQGSNTIATDTVWQSERTYYFKTGVSVNKGIKLTIQSATGKDIVTKWANTALAVYGTLQVTGSADHRVYFTDYRDDSVGGDTNGDGTTPVPAYSGWPGIWVYDGGTAALDQCDIRYGGSSNGALYKAGAGALSLTNSTISSSHYWGEGIYLDSTAGPVTISSNVITGGGAGNAYDGIYLTNAGSNVSISNNTIQNNRYHGIEIKNSSPQLSGNSITGNTYYGIYAIGASVPGMTADNAVSGNGYGAMGFDVPAVANAHLYDTALPGQTIIVDTLGGSGSSTVAANTVWQSARTYYFKTGVTVNSGVALTIQSAGNDIAIKWASGTQLAVNGYLLAQGMGGKKVYFTDYRDDSIGGDTNGNGSANGPSAGWWSGLSVGNNGTAALDGCEIRYAGWNSSAIYKTGVGSLSVTNSVVDHTTGSAVYLDTTSAAHTISGNMIRNSSSSGIYVTNSGAGSTINGNSIYSNTSYGIYLTGATSAPNISRNTIYSNNVGIYASSSANPVIGGSAGNGNSLYNNTAYSVQNATATSPPVINAQYNYWGSAAGPYHASTNTGGNQASKVSDNVNYDNWSLPPSGSITINGGAAATSNPDVTLTLACSETSGCVQMKFSNDEVTYIDLQSYATTTNFPTWNLPGTDGTKRVYVKFQYGNNSWSPTYQASIILDTIPKLLTTSITGYGAIDGTSVLQKNFTCLSGTCMNDFWVEDQVSMTATPATDFLFAGWNGACGTASGPCTLSMTDDRQVAATFTTEKPALLFAPSRSAQTSLVNAYTAALDNSSVTIMGRAVIFNGGLQLNRNIDVIFQGGYDAAFATVSGMSVVQGKVTISAGRLDASNLVVQQ